MKRIITYAVTGFFLPFVMAWMFTLLIGFESPDNYGKFGKTGLMAAMAMATVVGWVMASIKNLEDESRK